jgi:hypothetical protein
MNAIATWSGLITKRQRLARTPETVAQLADGARFIGDFAEVSPIAAEALRRIGTFYEIEDRIRGQSAGERLAAQQAETKPLIEEFKLWLDARPVEVSKKSGLARAIRYTRSHWDGLRRFLEDGRIEIDNNTVERTIRLGWPEESFIRRQSRWRRHVVDIGFSPQYGEVE